MEIPSRFTEARREVEEAEVTERKNVAINCDIFVDTTNALNFSISERRFLDFGWGCKLRLSESAKTSPEMIFP